MNDNLLQLKQAFADEGYDDDDDDDNTNTNDEPKTTIMASAHTRDDCSDLTDANNDHAEEQPNKSFPQRLLDILSNEAHADVISWLPHGTGFQIHKKKTFAAEILPIYFKASKFTSFTRKLNRWGFTRVPRGPETGAYFHKLFRRDKPELCLQMTSNSGNKYQAHPMMMNPAVALHHPPPSLLMPGMMPPGMPPMFPFMNPMMAAAAAASTNNTTPNNGTTTGTTTTGMTPQQQQQAMWQQQMHQMMMFQQQQMMQAQMQQGGGGNTATNQGFPMMGMPPLPTFPTNMGGMMMNSNMNTANNTTNNNNNNSMNPNTGAPTGSSSNNAMPHPGTSLAPHMNNHTTGTTNNNMNKPSGGGGDGSLSSLNPANNNATNTAASLLVPPVLKTEDDDDDDDHPGVMVGLGNHSLADDDDEDAPLGGTAHAKTV